MPKKKKKKKKRENKQMLLFREGNKEALLKFSLIPGIVHRSFVRKGSQTVNNERVTIENAAVLAITFTSTSVLLARL